MNIYEIEFSIYDVKFNLLGDKLIAVVIAENPEDAVGKVNFLYPFEIVDDITNIGVCTDTSIILPKIVSREDL